MKELDTVICRIGEIAKCIRSNLENDTVADVAVSATNSLRSCNDRLVEIFCQTKEMPIWLRIQEAMKEARIQINICRPYISQSNHMGMTEQLWQDFQRLEVKSHRQIAILRQAVHGNVFIGMAPSLGKVLRECERAMEELLMQAKEQPMRPAIEIGLRRVRIYGQMCQFHSGNDSTEKKNIWAVPTQRETAQIEVHQPSERVVDAKNLALPPITQLNARNIKVMSIEQARSEESNRSKGNLAILDEQISECVSTAIIPIVSHQAQSESQSHTFDMPSRLARENTKNTHGIPHGKEWLSEKSARNKWRCAYSWSEIMGQEADVINASDMLAR